MHRTPTFAIGLCVPALLAVPVLAQQFQEQTASRFPSPNPTDYTNYVEVGDIDNDGDLDLLFANGGNFGSPGPQQSIRVFINDGIGNFTDETAARTGGIIGWFRGATLGDIDDDGDLDMIVSEDFSEIPHLLVNDGTGVFADETGSRIPPIFLSSTRAQFGDIDNDGDLDIYINNGGPSSRFGCGQNRVWMNDGAGVFSDQTSTRHPIGNVCEPMDVIFFDWDNDFDLDIRTGNRGSGNSKLYENDGTGVFTDVSGGAPSDSACYSYDVGDINGDGNFDLIGANAGPANQELLLRGNGAGTFVNVSSSLSPNGSGDDNDSKFFDLDMDGDMDLVIAALFQSREKIYLNNGSGAFTQNSSIITASNDASLDVMVADFDADNRPDIVTGQGESGNFQNRIYMNVGGPIDSIGPSVPAMEQLPDTEDTVGPYLVRALVTDQITSDRGFFDRGVVIEYSINFGPLQQAPMKWVGHSLYRGFIPGQPAGSFVRYFVTATDWASNTASGPARIFNVEGEVLGDTDGDGDVDVDDLVAVILDWDTDGSGNGGDVDASGLVDVDDLVTVILNWTS